MKIVISPAKSLNLEAELPTTKHTQPIFVEDAFKINKKLAKQSKKSLQKLMGISANLAALNHQRYQDFEEKHTAKNARPAMYTFDGDVYQGLDAYTIPKEKIDVVQDRLRILSGLYGILKPLDLIQAYRLEMGTNLPIQRKKNLYEYWQTKVTKSLNEEMEKEELFVNLASNEYFKAIDTKKLKGKVISPVFKDMKNGKLKVISFFAKKARGSMVRYIIDKDIKTLEGLKSFDYDGYNYSEKETKKENEPVFIR
ncbi:peroxide stress protein YaaA [Mesonia sp. K7]|uniref:peroxide stress protein YaaA n=1 Tax=Mesonia sp. K7 TaxID=2218606 RepID=UPI000DA8DF01|nr:peroxide stress protein YaaA [Mesonia sp. K7]PZD78332.1 peroxide stress protein YaaA [Mesonia sp. K7]